MTEQEEAFALGVPRLLEFQRSIQQSQCILLVLSPAYLAEGFSQFTDLLAQSYGLETATWPVIPLILQPIVERLCAELRRPVPGLLPAPDCPYPGMVPFRTKDARFFFGRKGEIRELRQRLWHPNLMLVIGPSGSGKSSLIFASLVPELEQRQAGQWIVKDLRPGDGPVEPLAETLGTEQWPDEQGRHAAIEAALERQTKGHRLLLAITMIRTVWYA